MRGQGSDPRHLLRPMTGAVTPQVLSLREKLALVTGVDRLW
jgi:hypothetical protein